MRWESATGTPNVLAGSSVSFAAPLVAHPGTTFEYGINTDWLGKVVEAASGVTLDVAVKEEGITGPLGMNETTLPDEPRAEGQRDAGAPQGRGRHVGRQRDRAQPAAGVLRWRARSVLHLAGLHHVPARPPGRRARRVRILDSNFLPFAPQEAMDMYANFEKAVYVSR